jgi:aminodeoxyfutalosine synthase
MEGMSGLTPDEARALLADRSLITVGARGDEERRRRHGDRTTFVRVFEVHGDVLRQGSGQAIPAAFPASAKPGEVRITGRPASIDAAAASVRAARAMAGVIPVTGYSLADLFELAGGTTAALADALRALALAGLAIVAEAPLDLLPDPAAAIAAAHEAGVSVPRLTVQRAAAGGAVDLVMKARAVQAAAGGIRAFAPLARVSSVAQPSTGYDDVRLVALARLTVDNIDSIQVDWSLYGPKLAQFALTVGADDVDGVSALEGDLGRRRSPLEEIRGNIKAAGLQPIERDGSFAAIGQC